MELGSADNFLPVIPGRARHGFDHPRSVQRSSTGIVYSRSGGVGFWRGSFKLPLLEPKADPADFYGDEDDPLARRASGRHVLCFLQERDNNAGFFFADLKTLNKLDTDKRARTLDPPEWHTIPGDWTRSWVIVPNKYYTDANGDSIVDGKGLADDIDPGDIISFRETGGHELLPNYVSARVVIKKEPAGVSSSKIFFSFPLPQEFVEPTFGISKQICFNRPHCRAVILTSGTIWEPRHQYLDIPTISWVEDSIKSASSYKEGVRVFQLENDNIFQLENGKYLQL